jgi:glycosyltransferase involved in cell wall biosynthesis
MQQTGPRKILLIGDYPPPMGGISVHVQQLHRAFSRQGMTCKVLDIGKGENCGEDVLAGRGYSRFSRELLRHASAGWLLHLHTSGDNPKAWVVAMAVGLAGQMFRTPTLLTVHSGLLPRRLLTSAGLRHRAQLALMAYSHVVAVSDAVRGSLVELGLNPERVTTWPAFCPDEVRPANPPRGLAEARSRRRPLLCAAHHPSPEYGRKLLFEALARLATHHSGAGLALFGPETDSREFRADAQRFGVAGRLEDFGELDHGPALAVIEASDVFVRPTSADGDSVSVREALTLGVPCVATDVCARPAGVRVCRAGDPADLARKVDEASRSTRAPIPQPDTVAYLRALYDRLRPIPRGAGSEPATSGASGRSNVSS